MKYKRISFLIRLSVTHTYSVQVFKLVSKYGTSSSSRTSTGRNKGSDVRQAEEELLKNVHKNQPHN
jgi:hypothetical protein